MPTTRPNIRTYFMLMAQHVATRSTCAEAHVGAVIVSQENHVLATGYNGGLPGQPECSGSLDGSCKLIRHRANGEQFQLCPTIHAEANALAQYRMAHNKAHLPPGSTIYVTTFPCIACLQQLIQAKVENVVFGSLNSWYSPGQFYKSKINLNYYPLPNK